MTQSVGTESDWLYPRLIDIDSGKLAMNDPGNFASGAVVELEKGSYLIGVKVIEQGNELRISRLRVIRGQEELSGIGDVLFEVPVRDAKVAVGDYETAVRTCEDLGPAAYQKLKEQLDVQGLHGSLPTEHGSMFFVRTVAGDTSYPVYELRARSKRIGVEMIFIHRHGPQHHEDEKPYSLHKAKHQVLGYDGLPAPFHD